MTPNAPEAPDHTPARFLLELARDLHEAGTPGHRLEEAMGAIAGRLGMEAEIFSTPTSIFAAIGPLGEQRTYMLRVEPGEPDLERLTRVQDVISRVASGTLTPAQGLSALDEIPSPSNRYGRTATLAAFGVVSAGSAVFFGGSLGDLFAALITGLIVGAATIFASANRELRRVIETIAAALAAVAALVLERYAAPALIEMGAEWASVDAFRVTLSGLIGLLPGLTLTLAMNELANGQLVSGTGRLTHALMVLLSVGFGVALGRSLAPALPEVIFEASALPLWALPIGLALTPIAVTVFFRGRPRDLPLIVVTSVAGFYAARAGAAWIGPALGASVGAFVVGAIANVSSRVLRQPSAIAAIPALLLLVPGSLGYRSVEALLGEDATAGVQGLFTTLLVGASLVAGLLLSNIAVPLDRVVPEDVKTG
ncbi:MAG: threonine/serine exporter family protein [Planctomycetota bacterium]